MKAIVSIEDITKLSTLKASGLATQIYLILCAHEWGRDGSCFPSIATISKRLGNKYAESSIHRCLKWLEDAKLIVRNEARSKNRFVMVLRKIKAAVKDTILKTRHSHDKSESIREKKKKRNTYRYSKQASQRKSKEESYRKRLQKIAGWFEKVSDVKSMIAMRKDAKYASILAGMELCPSTYQYPDLKSVNGQYWADNEVRRVLLGHGYGNPDESWHYQYWKSLVNGVSMGVKV